MEYQLDLMRPVDMLAGEHHFRLSDIVDPALIDGDTISLYERMLDTDAHVHSLRRADRTAARRLMPVFRRLCWPGALSTLPRVVFSHHLDELTARARSGASLQRASSAEVLWRIAQFAEVHAINTDALEAMAVGARLIFGEVAETTAMTPSPEPRQRRVMPAMHLHLVE